MTDESITDVYPLRSARTCRSTRRIFLRNLKLFCLVGIHKHEKEIPQRICCNLDLIVRENDQGVSDDISNVVCYENVANSVRAFITSRHFNLIETLAEAVADICLKDKRVQMVRVCIEKMDVFSDAASAGVEIERFNFSS